MKKIRIKSTTNIIYILLFLCYFTPLKLKAEADPRKIEAAFTQVEALAQSSPQAALVIARDACGLSVRMNDKIYLARNYMLLGKVFRYLGMYEESIDFLRKSESLFTTLGSSKYRALVLIELASTNIELELYETALVAAFAANDLSDGLKDYVLKAKAYKEIGLAYIKLGLYRKASQYLENSIKLFDQVKDKYESAGAKNIYGTCLFKLGDASKAIEMKNQAYSSIDYPYLKAEIALSMADIYASQSLTSKFFENYSIALSIFSDYNNKFGAAKAYAHLAKFYLTERDYQKTIYFGNLALTEPGGDFNLKTKTLAYRSLVEAYEATSNFKSAYLYSKYEKALADSIRKIQKKYNLDRMNSESELASRKEQIKEASQTSVGNSNHIIDNQLLFIISLVITALSLALLTAFNRNYIRNKKVNQELKLLNDELGSKNAVLVESEMKLRETNAIKDKFYSIIAHDIRNPLNPIGVGIEILKHRKKMNLDDEKQDKIIGDLEKAAHSLAGLLENLLQWTNFQKQKMPFLLMPFDLYDVIKENEAIHAESIKLKKLMFFSDIKKNTTIYADKNMINVVVRNLISNAIKFTESDGVIKISYTKKDKFSEISIIDTGVGMSAETVEGLFKNDNFHTTAGTYEEKGTGLGLKLCKEFIEKHGGVLKCKSHINSGSTFKFTLPDRTEFRIEDHEQA